MQKYDRAIALDDGLALDEQMIRIALNEGISFRLFSSTSVMRGLHVALDWPSPLHASLHLIILELCILQRSCRSS